jgi:DNA mismatch endonuclease (patch repair protein)
MIDSLTPTERSDRMSRIRAKDTKPEMLVRRFLHLRGFRYRLHVKGLPGCPDLVLRKYGVVILVEGCFWHGHVCQSGRAPKTNPEFWRQKIATNRSRDRRNQRSLRVAGWKVLRVWECQLATIDKRDRSLMRLELQIIEAQRSSSRANVRVRRGSS